MTQSTVHPSLLTLAEIIDDDKNSLSSYYSVEFAKVGNEKKRGTKRSIDSSSDISSNQSSTVSAKKICLAENVKPMKAKDTIDLSSQVKDIHSDNGSTAIPRRWTPEEDDRLLQAVKLFGEVDWKLNSDFVGTRDNVQCRQRWQKVLLPGLHKGKWTEEEDILLRYLVSLRLENWGVVAARLPGRTSKQCRERWCHHLAPNVDKSAMTPEENKKLMELHAKWGNRWSKIAAEMPGRTENMVRSRIQILKKAEQRSERHAEKPIEFSKLPTRTIKPVTSGGIEQMSMKPLLPSPTVPDFKVDSTQKFPMSVSKTEAPLDLLASKGQTILTKSKIAMSEMQSFQQNQSSKKDVPVAASLPGSTSYPFGMDSLFPKNHPKSKLLHKFVMSGPEYSARDHNIMQHMSLFWPAMQSSVINANGAYFSSPPLLYANPIRDLRTYVVDDGLSYPVMTSLGPGAYPHVQQDLASLHHAHLLGQAYLRK